MAKIQLSMEELLQLVRGKIEFPELKKKLAKAMLEVWNSEEMRSEITSLSEELAKKKMEHTIEGAFKEETKRWSNEKTLVGWAAPIIREEIAKATLPVVLEAIKPELENMVSELVKKEFGVIILDLFKKQSEKENA